MTEHRGRPIRRWKVQPLRTLEGDVGVTCPDERCGSHGKPVKPVPHPWLADRQPNRCPTCLTTVAPLNHSETSSSDRRKEPTP